MPTLVYWALRVAAVLSRAAPSAWRDKLGMLGGTLAYWCWPAKRWATRRTMAVVTGDRENGACAEAAARAAWRNYGRFVVAFLDMPNRTPEEIARRTHVTGWEHLDRAIAAGKGVVIVTGHLGLWDHAAAVVAARYPGRMYNVVEPFASPRMDEWVQGQRAAKGMTIIPMTGVRQMVRALRGGGLLTLLVDRPLTDSDAGVRVTFFGRHTTVPAGAATLAALTGAAIIPGCLIPRHAGPVGAGWDYDGFILPAVEPSASGDRATDVQRMTQGIFNALESMIRRNPEHWYMFRDMWARPGGQVSTAPVGAGGTA